jgi:hypothetical protein
VVVKLEIAQMLVLSTAHIPENIADQLPRDAGDEGPDWSPTFTRDSGWLWHVPPLADNGEADEVDGTPAELSAVFRFAREQGCVWVMLDSDGPAIDELPTWEW